jgi:hypothetical protein
MMTASQARGRDHLIDLDRGEHMTVTLRIRDRRPRDARQSSTPDHVRMVKKLVRMSNSLFRREKSMLGNSNFLLP